MGDSNVHDALAAKHDRDREQRLQAIKRWAAYIAETPSEKWGPQQNTVVNAQLKAAQAADLSAEHQQRVRDVATKLADRSNDE